MTVDRFGVQVADSAAWHVAIDRRPAAGDGTVNHPVMHACTLPLPKDRGDFGSGVVDLLGSEDVFVALIEYGVDVADHGLFAAQGMPKLAPSQFSPSRLQRPLPGRSAAQHFFSSGGRAFCLFAVVGSHGRRMATVPRAAGLVKGLTVTDKATMLKAGGLP